MQTYRFYQYDVWGNEKEGFEVNDVHQTLITIEVPDDFTDDQFFEIVYENIGLKCEFAMSWENDEIAYLTNSENAEPLGEFRFESKQ